MGSFARGTDPGDSKVFVDGTGGKKIDVSQLLHTLDAMKDTETRVKKLADVKVDCSFKHGVLAVSVSGFVSSVREWEDKVVVPSLQLCPGESGMRLSLDLRRLFFVSKETVLGILYQMAVWSSTRFSRVCLVLPPSKRVRANMESALASFFEKPPHYEVVLPEFKCVERARDVRSFLES